jgi:magnesium-transporting ATPase (P-type)
MLAMLTKHCLEYYGYIVTNFKTNLLDYNSMLQVLILTLCLIMSVIPEALDLAVLECISVLSQVNLCTQKKLVFRKLKSLINMGRIDCLVLEKNGTFTESNDSSVEVWEVLG